MEKTKNITIYEMKYDEFLKLINKKGKLNHISCFVDTLKIEIEEE